MRSQISYGDGMYKSTDAGKTWNHIGLEDTRQIGRVLVDPQNPNVVFVAALGHAYGPNAERGVFRSTDGGATWQKVLYKNENVGAIDLAFDPRNPQIVYASLWATRRPPWTIYPPSIGPGGGLFKSTDGGSTWKELAGGLPAGWRWPHRHRRCAERSESRLRNRGNSDAKKGGLYRSDDAGATWQLMDNDSASGDAAGISASPPSIRKILTNSTSRILPSIAPMTAEKLSFRSKARPAATIITSSGFIPTMASA